MTNWERYLRHAGCRDAHGSAHAARRAAVPHRGERVQPLTACMFESRWVRDFASWGEYQDWLNAEYDDGTIKWEEDAR